MTNDSKPEKVIASRGFGFIFSLLAFVIMTSNKHGDWREFDRYEEYRYVVAIAILSTFYTGFQVFREVRQLSTGREMFSSHFVDISSFIGGAYNKQNERKG